MKRKSTQTKSIKTKKCKNGVNETTKDNERWGRTTCDGEHHIPVRTWTTKRDKIQEGMREREKGNVSERELWSSNAHKSENEGGRQSVKVKTVKLEAPHQFWASNKNKDLIKPNKTKQARQSKQAIEGDLGFGLVWVSERLIGKEPMHNWGEFH